MHSGLDLEILPGRYAVARLDPGTPVPAWAGVGDFHCSAMTRDETSVVCAEGGVPPGVTAETGFRCIKVAGPLDFSLTGVLASLAAPLAEAGVSIFAVSTYDTDYILVRDRDLENARHALNGAEHRISG